MPDVSIDIATQGGAVTGNVTTGGDFAGRDLHKHTHYHGGPGKEGMLYVGVPPMPPYFFGRTELVDELVNRLCAGQTTALSADGLPGVGKTTLAVALARDPRLLAHFHDGILWAGLGRTPDVASIQATWGDALGVELRDLIDPYARTQRLTNAIGNRRLLLVLDDVWQWDAAAQLRCSAPGVATLLTTRDQAIARRFAGAQQSVNVPVLAPQPAYDLLSALAPEACASDPAAAHRLAALVDGLPLALELLGGYLGASSQRRTHARRQQALTTLTDPAARLALATRRLGDPQHQEVTLQETIALSLADLPIATVAAFHALGAFAPKPARFDLPAALAVTGADEETLFTLADHNLVEMGADETLGLHQTLSALVRTKLPVEVTSRHRDYYLALVDEDREDWQQIETIYAQINFAWQQLSENDAIIIPFVSKMGVFQLRRGLWLDRLDWLQLANKTAKLYSDIQVEARIKNNLGFVHSALGNKVEALRYYEQALPLWRQRGDRVGEATTLNNIGGIFDELGDKPQALLYYEQALPIRRAVEDKQGEAITLNNIGSFYLDLGNIDHALAYLNQALSLQQQIGNKAGEANILNNIGLIYSKLGDQVQSLTYYNQALLLLRQVGDKIGEATTLNNLGAIYHRNDNVQHAFSCYQLALTLCCQIGNKAGEATTLNNLGGIHDILGDKRGALDYYEQALALHQLVGNKAGEVTTLNNMAMLFYYAGDFERSAQKCEAVRIIAEQIGNVASTTNILFNLATIYHTKLKRTQDAIALIQRSIALLEQKYLLRDGFGRTLADHQAYLAQLIGGNSSADLS